MTKRIEEYVKPANVEGYVRSAVKGFVSDPPDSDFQRGYLAAMLIVAEQALGHRLDLPPTPKPTRCKNSKEVAINAREITLRISGGKGHEPSQVEAHH
jgi:hypothetical protein